MDALKNLPKFYIGQAVICITKGIHPALKFGDKYKVKSMSICECGCGSPTIWVANLTNNSEMQCCVSGKVYPNKNNYLASNFAPIQESTFPSMTMKEVIEVENKLISLN